ncbi:hypothetical protein P692DRAFT_20723843, partial [Suillus brevipes Sb2]
VPGNVLSLDSARLWLTLEIHVWLVHRDIIYARLLSAVLVVNSEKVTNSDRPRSVIYDELHFGV